MSFAIYANKTTPRNEVEMSKMPVKEFKTGLK